MALYDNLLDDLPPLRRLPIPGQDPTLAASLSDAPAGMGQPAPAPSRLAPPQDAQVPQLRPRMAMPPAGAPMAQLAGAPPPLSMRPGGIPSSISEPRFNTRESLLPSGTAAPNATAAPPYERGTLGGEQQKLTDLRTSGSGISQIKNPWARIPLQILDAIGGSTFPGLTMGIPGTEMHHRYLVHQQEKGVEQIENAAKTGAETAREAAQTDEAKARADAARNPLPEEPKTPVQLFNRQNRQGTLEEFNKANEKPTAEVKPDLHTMYAEAVKAAIDKGVDPGKDPQVQTIGDSLKALQKESPDKGQRHLQGNLHLRQSAESAHPRRSGLHQGL
jgi:hypothetical protein